MATKKGGKKAGSSKKAGGSKKGGKKAGSKKKGGNGGSRGY
jgi:hypothetical protein